MYKQNFVAVVKCNGNILREKNGGEVYLPFGTNYSVLLKNKDARSASVDIEVDGESVLNGHKLILDGNETREIKGFMCNMKKTNRFKFIKKTKEIQKHRGDKIDDGLIRIVYQFECQKQEESTISYTYPYYVNTKFSYLDNSPGISPTTINEPNSVFYSCNSNSLVPCSDEGITVKGEKIKQHYRYGDIGPLESAIHTIVLHLKGQTERRKKVKKAITVKTKLSCETCGRKNKSTNKYCYNCGTYLN